MAGSGVSMRASPLGVSGLHGTTAMDGGCMGAGVCEGLRSLGSAGSEAQAGSGGHHRGAPCAGSRSTGTPPARGLDGLRMRSWCGANRRRTPAWRRAAELNVHARARPWRRRVGPSMMQNSGPSGSSTPAASRSRSCSQPPAQSVTPGPRLPERPRRHRRFRDGFAGCAIGVGAATPSKRCPRRQVP